MKKYKHKACETVQIQTKSIHCKQNAEIAHPTADKKAKTDGRIKCA